MNNPRFLCGFLLALALSGCTAPRVPPEIAAPYDPVFAILHCPFGAPGQATVARPQPDRSGWTNGRMDLDLRRMRDARLDLVFVVLDASRTEAFHLERLQQFARLAAELEGAPRVSLWLRADGTAAPELRSLIADLLQTGAPNSPAWFRLDQRPLLVLDDAGSSPPRHPAFTIREAGQGGPGTWVSPGGPQRQPRFGAGGQQALVSGGYWDAGRQEWIVKREGGKTFRQQLWSAVERRPRFLVVSSWDAFHRGDFLMPNSLDGEAAYKHLVNEGNWLRRLAAGTRTAGGF